ncbi:MAG TPA: hypothetical protein VN364_10730 [Bellilinea sp.]|nr:hypothetical protein [Bellilinea sp.]
MNETESNDAQVLLLDNWIVRVRRPISPSSSQVFLLLHGLTGDEHSMTVFTRNLPQDAWILSPRAPIALKNGGYKWITPEQGMTASYAEFKQAANQLQAAYLRWSKSLQLPASPANVIGFSQGAVMAAALLLLNPQVVDRLGFLSGFLPGDTPQYILPNWITGKKVFVAHGSQDKTVPIEKAQQTAQWLQQWGAAVTYCEAAVGHRLSASCFRSFAEFFKTPA